MNPIDKKILDLIDFFKQNSTIRFDQDFCDASGILRQNLYRVKKELAHFTPEHIQGICKAYNINSNWILGIEKNMFRTNKASVKSKVFK